MLSHVSSSSHQLSSNARWASSCDTFFSHFQCCHHPFHQARFPAAFSFATVSHPAFFVIACLTPRPHTARRVIPFSDFQVNKVLPVGSFHRASSIPIWQPRSASSSAPSFNGSPLCALIFTKKVAAPASILFRSLSMTALKMSASFTVAMHTLLPSPIHFSISVRAVRQSTRSNRSFSTSTASRAASKAASSGLSELAPSSALPTRRCPFLRRSLILKHLL